MYGLPIADCSVEDLHPVAGSIDKDKHVSVYEAHPHLVRDYAAQAVEHQTHVYRTAVEPVPALSSGLNIGVISKLRAFIFRNIDTHAKPTDGEYWRFYATA